MIEVRNLVKKFGNLTAVADVSFEVEKGEVLGFLGPNGAGKSTTMKMITGFLEPTAGFVKVNGFHVQNQPLQAKRQLGYLPEGAPLYPDMTPRSLLRFIADVRGLKGRHRRERIEKVVALTHLEEVWLQSIDTLSKGFKRRVGLAQAILHDPEILILDEPTDGLDPNQKAEVRQLIREMAQDKVIVLSTHILEEVEAVCSRAMIIDRGRLRFDGEPGELKLRSPQHNAVSLTVRGADQNVAAALQALPHVAQVQPVDRDGLDAQASSFMIFPAEGKPVIHEVSHHARQAQWEVVDLHVEQGRLDDVFRQLTIGEAPGTP
ncbi:MAG: ABC transporter ATP-binding protein [Planctomycetota bacterium]|nr:MAG: ABC transporter ATP-binding protein [Planctomycetota bacterium]